MKINLIKNILIFALGAEAWHVYEHVSWQFLSDRSMINVVLTQAHNELSILVNSFIILLLILGIYFINKKNK